MRKPTITRAPEEVEVRADINQHAELQKATKIRTDMFWLATQV